MMTLLLLASQAQPSFSCSSSSTLIDLKNCNSLKTLHQLHAVSIKTNHINDPLIAAEILRFSAISFVRDVHYALQVFDQISQPNIFYWNTLIRAFSQSDEASHHAVILYAQLLHSEPHAPNRYTFPSLLKACARIPAIEEGKQIHCHAIKLGFFADRFVLTNLARMYALCGRIEDARRSVQESRLLPGSEANTVIHNILVDGYCRLGMISNAAQVFDEMNFKAVIS
ncbi:Pentatricopeptide repeat-containing protein [Platanthera guangdongensis]|uniref:Pentatricopeptide repeat-containing protein n=1 Tax=Platanthera guangdongensis TaxID=2320717 RepID=A0ABR2LQV3_9ASPA